MAEHVLKDALLVRNGLLLTQFVREVALMLTAESKDISALDDKTRNRLGGLKDVALSAAGYWQAQEPDSALFLNTGSGDQIFTAGYSSTIGETVYFFRSIIDSFTPLNGSVGDVAGFEMHAAAYLNDLVRGTLIENGTRSASGNSTGRQLGAVSSAQKVYAALHILAISGTWAIVVESDDNAGFTTPTTRISPLATAGGQFLSAIGAITDTWWRYKFTLTGTGSIIAIGSIGIQ